MAARTDRPADEASSRTRPGGRPLDEGVGGAILNATWKLLLEDGYSRLSIARVADEAGVGRPAIYRRYSDKAELVAAVIEDKASRVPPVDTGSAREDLIAHLEFARRRFAMGLAGTLLAEERKHPELLELFRKGMLAPRRDQVAAALERGKARGEVRADLDVNLAAHAVLGSFVYSGLVAGRPRRGWAEDVIATLWPAFAANGAARAKR
jgi:AcrR family transcriptional regulator